VDSIRRPRLLHQCYVVLAYERDLEDGLDPILHHGPSTRQGCLMRYEARRGCHGTIQPSILIVNPDDHICLGITSQLEANGYEVECVRNGKACLNRIRQRPFDAVFLNVYLPDQHSRVVLDAIRAMHPEWPVIFMTAWPLPRHTREQIVGAVLQLPYEPKDLENILEKAIGETRLENERTKEDSYSNLSFHPICAAFSVKGGAHEIP
jgi:CheY-like chemotaxis protein